MRAVVQDAYGEADVLRLEEIDRPAIGDDEVLVRVHAAGVDQGAWHLMAGLPYPIRLAGYGAPGAEDPGAGPRGRRPRRGGRQGRDHAATGRRGVRRRRRARSPSTRRAAAGKLAPKPANLTFQQAAAVPISGLTALQAVRDQGRVQPGQRVLVIGASGGVGSFAVQIAKAFGAEVTGVCSTGKVDLVRSLGADHVVDYQPATTRGRGAAVRRHPRHRGQPPAARAPARAHADRDARARRGRDRRALARRHSTVSCGRWRCRRSSASGCGSFIASENAADLVALTDLVESGAVTPAVDRTFPLAETPAAIRYLREGRARGKVVIEV